MTRPFYETFDPEGMYKTDNYHHAMRAGNTLYVAGQVARDVNRELVGPGDAGRQAAEVYDHLSQVLRAAGAEWWHVVKITTYLVNREDSPAVTAVRFKYLGDHRPPHTGVIVAGLGSDGVLVEVEVIAVLPVSE
jgi:2-iminobutanoate/2-iminopropanoate deaminase